MVTVSWGKGQPPLINFTVSCSVIIRYGLFVKFEKNLSKITKIFLRTVVTVKIMKLSFISRSHSHGSTFKFYSLYFLIWPAEIWYRGWILDANSKSETIFYIYITVNPHK